jgi:hypothetical protein
MYLPDRPQIWFPAEQRVLVLETHQTLFKWTVQPLQLTTLQLQQEQFPVNLHITLAL